MWDSGELRLLAANHEDWSDRIQAILILTPADDDGVPLYDLPRRSVIDAADKNFWTWGQHNIVEIPNDEPVSSSLWSLIMVTTFTRRCEKSVAAR